MNTKTKEEMFEDTKGVIRSCKSKEDRLCNGQKKRDKQASKDPQNITPKTKNRATWTPLKPGGELRCSGRVRSSYSTFDTRRVPAIMKSLVCYIHCTCVCQLIKSLGNIWWVRWIIIKNNVFLVSFFFFNIFSSLENWRLFLILDNEPLPFPEKDKQHTEIIAGGAILCNHRFMYHFSNSKRSSPRNFSIKTNIGQLHQSFLVQSKKIWNCFQSRSVRTTHSL